MPSKLEQKDLSKLVRFLKTNDINYKNKKLKEIASNISGGFASEIIGEKHLISKTGNKINSYVNVIAFKDQTAQIRNLVFSETTTQNNINNLIQEGIAFLLTKNSKNIELITQPKLEKLFKKINFEKIGEKDNQIFMRYKTKKEVQYNLKKQLDDVELMNNISEKTSEQLRKLR